MFKKSVMVALVVCAVLCLSAGTLVSGEKCKQVVIGKTLVDYIVDDPEMCDGYDACASSEVRGTFNGTLLEYAYSDDVYNVTEDTYVFKNYGRIEMAHGELFLVEWAIADFSASDGYAVHIKVEGGTGRYEGASGWMAYSANFANTDTVWGGEVCWPED